MNRNRALMTPGRSRNLMLQRMRRDWLPFGAGRKLRRFLRRYATLKPNRQRLHVGHRVSVCGDRHRGFGVEPTDNMRRTVQQNLTPQRGHFSAQSVCVSRVNRGYAIKNRRRSRHQMTRSRGSRPSKKSQRLARTRNTIASRASRVADPKCGNITRLSHCTHCGATSRSTVKHVQPSTNDCIEHQRLS